VTQTLQSALEALYGLERRKNKLGLEGTRMLLEGLGHPERRFLAVHVAGTNGKGSTCALIDRVLREAGRRTGLFTSPHLVDFRERIRVNGRWADETRLFQMLERIQALPEASERTFFEITTALGFEYFAAENVEWAVVEVGLGGRLDTTNVLEPEVCAITSIGLDHTEILGDTIEAIAYEKAGIIKPGVPVVVAAGIPAAARAVIALEREDEVLIADPPSMFACTPRDKAVEQLAVHGIPAAAHHGANYATALRVLEVLERRGVHLPKPAIERGLWLAKWPGRLEPAPRAQRLFWDGAHNPEGARALAAAWLEADLAAPGAVVLALSRDKDVDAMLEALAPLVSNATVFATRTRNERAMEPERIVAAAQERGMAARVEAAVVPACRAALEATAPSGKVLLTGSLFAVGEAMEAFGGAPGERL
jgi:dihydrofolate synthase/folylpolyglutamate synthase